MRSDYPDEVSRVGIIQRNLEAYARGGSFLRTMELTRQRLISIIIIITIATALGLYLFLFRPCLNKLKVAHLECTMIETGLLQAQEAIASSPTVSAKKSLLTEKDVPMALESLTKEGKSRGINFISITPGQIENTKLNFTYKIMPIELELESKDQPLFLFLGSLDELEKSMVTVRSFNVTSTKEDSTKLISKLVVNLYLSGKNAE